MVEFGRHMLHIDKVDPEGEAHPLLRVPGAITGTVDKPKADVWSLKRMSREEIVRVAM